MALHPISQPATSLSAGSVPPPDSSQPTRDPSRQAEVREPHATLSDLAKMLSLSGGGSSSIDLALDLVLNEIVQEARAATGAAGAAIALVREGAMVCRATTGMGGPNLGMRLDKEAGLSGMGLRTGEVQRCDDCETDTRVDPAACRALGVRSILVVPLDPEADRDDHKQGLGLIETFSSEPNAFDDNDVRILKALSSQIISFLAPPTPDPPNLTEVETQPFEADKVDAVIVQGDQTRHYSSARWMTFLTLAVIACAFLLGWALGRGNSNAPRATEKSFKPSSIQAPAAQLTNDKSEVENGSSLRPTEPSTSRPIQRERHSIVTAGGLVVYEKGRVIFRTQPNGLPPETRSNEGRGSPLTAATPHVLRKVAPIYPELAKQKHIQGPVEIATTVDRTGAVEKAIVISGDPILGASATAAISQWRFEPVMKDGKPTGFQTVVKVGFKLP